VRGEETKTKEKKSKAGGGKKIRSPNSLNKNGPEKSGDSGETGKPHVSQGQSRKGERMSLKIGKGSRPNQNTKERVVD